MLETFHKSMKLTLFTKNSTDSGVDNDWYFLQEYGVRGSLQDILGRVQITWQVKKSFMRDISCGMQYMYGFCSLVRAEVFRNTPKKVTKAPCDIIQC